VGLLEQIHSVASGVSLQRNVLASAWSASRQSTIAAARKVAALDSSMALAAANQAILQSKRDTLDSSARRKLRSEVWQALEQDRRALDAHAGEARLAVAWIVSLTAEDDRHWHADLWLPVAEAPPESGTQLDLWEAAVQACTEVMLDLHGPDQGPELIAAEGLFGIRVKQGAGCSLDDLRAAVGKALDRTRVRAVALHQARVEVSLVWLDLAVDLDGEPTPLHGLGLEDVDTLVGKAVGK
jgi:hypothetical protein